ncbi:hypothetical protein [Polycladidibacter hongkongensis]|uniref:hypothetical protein n=1 Tax=Polycladidibacter hongkongensis TaxID=1647556 RepID=UPI00082F7DD0|nr:hypothetical protein [Pseudovibrio hongkongensis]
MGRWLIIAVAVLCLILGLLTVWLPIPTGVPLLAIGTVLLLGVSRKAARWLRRNRNTYRWLNHAVGWVEVRTSGRIHRILRRTRPRYRKRRRRFSQVTRKQAPNSNNL